MLQTIQKILIYVAIIMTLSLASGCFVTRFPTGNCTYEEEQFKVRIKIKECVICMMDGDYRKKVIINGKKSFKLTMTQERNTSIIYGTTNPNSLFHRNGIERLIIFPNTWNHVNVFDFDTEKPIDKSVYKMYRGDVESYWDIEKIQNDMLIELSRNYSCKNM